MRKIRLLIFLAFASIFLNGCEMPYDFRESEPIWTEENKLYVANNINQFIRDWQVSPDDKMLAYLEIKPSFFLRWHDLTSGKDRMFGPVQLFPDYNSISSIFWDETNSRAVIFSQGEIWMYDSTAHHLWYTHIDFKNYANIKMQNVRLNNVSYQLISYNSNKFGLFNFHTFQSVEIDFQPDTLNPPQQNLKYFVKRNSDTVYAIVSNNIMRFSLSSVPQHLEMLVESTEIPGGYIWDIFQVDENHFGYTTYRDSLVILNFNQLPPLSISASYSLPVSKYIATIDKKNILFWGKLADLPLLFDLTTGSLVTLNYPNVLKNSISSFTGYQFIPENRSLFSFTPVIEQPYLSILNLDNQEKIITDNFLQGNPKALCWQNNEKLLLINNRRSESRFYDFIQTYSLNSGMLDSIGILPTNISPDRIQLFSDGVLIRFSEKFYLFDLTGQELNNFAYNCGTFDPYSQSYLFLRYRNSNQIELGSYRSGDSLRTHIYQVSEHVNLLGLLSIPPNSPLNTRLGYRYCLNLMETSTGWRSIKLTNDSFSEFQTILDNIDINMRIKLQWDGFGKNLYYGGKRVITKLRIWYEF